MPRGFGDPGRLRARATRGEVALLALSALVVYANCLLNDFVWDDLAVVVARIGSWQLSDIPSLFLQADSVGGIGAPYYRPVSLSTYVVDAVLHGDRAAGFHLTNLLLHALAVVALYRLSIELFGSRALAAIASLLLSVHPVNAEAVCFISARNNILASLCVLTSFSVYLRDERGGRAAIPARFLSALLFLLGLLCKEPAAMLVFVLAYHAWATLPSPGRGRALVSRLWPFAAALAIYVALRTAALGAALGVELEAADLGARAWLNIGIIPRYLGLLLLPLDLSVSRLAPEGGYPLSVGFALAWVGIAAGVFLLWRSKRPATRLGLVWFALNYLPISNLIPTPSAEMAERFLYLPAIGLWWVVADQLVGLSEKLRTPRVLRAACAGVLAVLAAQSFARTFDWRSNVSLFEKEVEVHPLLAENHYNLCTSFLEIGDFVRAEAACLEAERLDPGDPDALTQLGNLQQARGRHPRALSYYRRALEADPHHVTARYNLARLLEALGRRREATAQYRTLERLLPPGHALRPHLRERLRGIAASPEAPVPSGSPDRGPE